MLGGESPPGLTHQAADLRGVHTRILPTHNECNINYRYVSINIRPSNYSRPLTFPISMMKKISKHHYFVTTYDRGIIHKPLKMSFQDLSNGTKYMWARLIVFAPIQNLKFIFQLQNGSPEIQV